MAMQAWFWALFFVTAYRLDSAFYAMTVTVTTAIKFNYLAVLGMAY